MSKLSNHRNEKPGMSYRRFGRSNNYISVITLGGMRFVHNWEAPMEQIPKDTLEDAVQSIDRAFQSGINMIETAHGYMKSERTIGMALKELGTARGDYFLMTKGIPHKAEEVRPMVEQQLQLFGTDYLDYWGWHGMNTHALVENACKSGGPIEELLKLKEEGLIGHIGFSSHAPLEVQIRAVETGLFDFVNLHYYYFFQRNRPVVELAELRDMGVFIISPNDKGGQLFNAPPILKKLTEPYTPIQWNARFCLSTPAVHTLSFGITQESHFQEMEGIFPLELPLPDLDRRIHNRMEAQWLKDPYSSYEGYNLQDDSSGIAIPDFLRMRRMWKCFDMLEFGQYRYNMFSPEDHWAKGALAHPPLVEQIDDSKVPEGIPLKEMLKETHRAFYIKKKS